MQAIFQHDEYLDLFGKQLTPVNLERKLLEPSFQYFQINRHLFALACPLGSIHRPIAVAFLSFVMLVSVTVPRCQPFLALPWLNSAFPYTSRLDLIHVRFLLAICPQHVPIRRLVASSLKELGVQPED